jgi:putative ABC transport system substrate-binding protein
MRRRQFITLLGGAAAAWPLTARAQQAMPAIGFLASQLPDAITDRLRGFRQGLKDTGYVEGENVAIVYRFAENQDDRLPALAADLVNNHVDAIIAAAPPALQAAAGATTNIPVIAIDLESDPVASGFVMSLAQPGRNISGVFLDFPDFSAKCHHTAVAARSRRRGDRITPLMHPHCCTRSSLLLAHSDASRQRSTSVAFGTKRTY